ncbi:MAG: sulfatase [Planctomycetes bacterium]|nr:sulfatase [Planctomycetota bacterium]
MDTTRPDHLGCYGYARPTSPAIDALAARGVRFDRAWSHAPETGPSLATVLTSRRAPATGVRGNAERLDDSLPTLATVAKASGLRTGAFVSTVLLRRDVCGFDRGFDVYDDQMTDPCFGHDRAQRIAERTVDAAVAWLGASAEPSFCWVHLYEPHGPYTPPEPTPALDATRTTLEPQAIRKEWVPAYQRVGDSLDAADYVDRYDREIAVMDRHLARLFAAADPSQTLVVVHADHGEALGEDGYWFRHGSLLHDAALRVPWIVAGPGVAAGRVVGADVRLIDLAPTVLDLAGLQPAEGAEGNDLAGAVRATSGTAGVTPPSTLVAEARRREIVRDATGVDVRWKVRVRTAAVDVVMWPTDRGAHGPPAAWDIARAWLTEPPRRTPPPPAAPGAPRSDVDRAMEGLGYR